MTENYDRRFIDLTRRFVAPMQSACSQTGMPVSYEVMSRPGVKWIVRGAAVLIALYAALFGTVAIAMLQPPERFGRIMKHLPQPLVWMTLPAPRMWMWARAGSLSEGDIAPDFTLSTLDRSGEVTLSSHRGDRPVVLVFGSYT